MATTYLSPGVYIEEVDKGTKPIQGVPTAIAAFIGFTEKAEEITEDKYTTKSILSKAKLITNWGQYQQHFGGLIEDAYLPYAVRGFFDNGGSICHVVSVRTFGALHPAQILIYGPNRKAVTQKRKEIADKANKKQHEIPPQLFQKADTEQGEPSLVIHAKQGGPAGDTLKIKIEAPNGNSAFPSSNPPTPRQPSNLFGEPRNAASGAESTAQGANVEAATAGGGSNNPPNPLPLPQNNGTKGEFVLVVERNGTVLERHAVEYEKLPFWGNRSRETENAHSKFEHVKVWSLNKSGLLDERLPLLNNEYPLVGGATKLDLEFIETDAAKTLLADPKSDKVDDVFKDNSLRLFEGKTTSRKGIGALDAVDNVNVICAPDVMLAHEKKWITDEQLQGIQQAMLDHCARTHYRFAILDAPSNKKTAEDILEWRMNIAGYDSMHGALYYPWVKISDPVTQRSRFLPPSGFIAGIYARSDDQRGVHKAPANEVVAGVIDLETHVTKGEQDLLNPNGINCIRKFPGRGIRVWGARTLSSDPSWRYINVRRLFNYVEESIERNTQWIVFEPNDQVLWAKVRRDITAFLRTVWLSGALFGTTPEQAFYVKCDEETNLPELRDLGQMICEIGMAPVKPAEFVIFRFSQWANSAEV